MPFICWLQSWEKVDWTGSYSPDMTPLILAAHRNNYEIIKMLLDRGATLPMPHDIRYVLLVHFGSWQTIRNPNPKNWECNPYFFVGVYAFSAVLTSYRCGCDVCVESSSNDSLRHSLDRVNEYRALASPSLIALSSNDPILTAFQLSWELRNLAFDEQESKNEYLVSECLLIHRKIIEKS